MSSARVQVLTTMGNVMRRLNLWWKWVIVRQALVSVNCTEARAWVKRGGIELYSVCFTFGWACYIVAWLYLMEIVIILLFFLFLLVINMALVACQFSLVKLRYLLLEEADINELRQDKAVARMLDRTEVVSRVIRFGGTLCTISMGLAIYALLLRLKGQSEGVSIGWLAFALVVTLGIHYVVCDVLPRVGSLRSPQRTLKQSSLLIRALSAVLAPVMWLSHRVDRWAFRRFGLDPDEDINHVDVEVQTRALQEDDIDISPQLRQIMSNALRMRELDLSDILLPRGQLQYMDLEDTLEENLELAKKMGHTRFPLCEGDLDKCIGILHIKDVFRYRGDLSKLDLRKLKRDIIHLPESLPVEEGLERLMRARMHMALVVDEFGGTQGVVTLESILEELVGDIQDEFDLDEKRIHKQPDGSFLISGLAPIHEVERDLNVEIDNGDVATFGGLITAELGRIPLKGEKVLLSGPEPPLDITVSEVTHKRVISAEVYVVVPDSEGD